MITRRLVVTLLSVVAMAGCSKSAQQYLDSGNKYFAAQKYKEAVVEYKNAVKQDPKFGDAHFKLAETLIRIDDGSGALREYVYAADLLPKSKEAQLKAGTLLLMAARYDEARSRAQKALQIEPKNLEAQLLLSNASLMLKEIDKAITQVEEAIQLDPRHGRSYTTLGAVEAAKGDMAAAERAFRQGVELDPKSPMAHLALAQFLVATGRGKDAESSYKTAYELDPKDTRPARALAWFYIASGRPAEAELYLKGVADSSKQLKDTLALADYYAGMQRFDEATALLVKLAANPDAFANAKLRLAEIEYSQNKTVEAHKTIDELLARDARNPGALLAKARFLFREKKFDEALKKAEGAVAADPSSVPAHYLLGTIYATKGNTDKALGQFTEVLRLNPRAVAAQLQIAGLQMANGTPAGSAAAVQMAQAAVTAEPDNALARLVLVRSLLVKGDLVAAEKALKELEANYPKAAPVHSTLGSLAMAKNDAAGARRAFDKALELDPKSNEALAGLVLLDLQAKKLPEARARVEARLAKTPDDPQVLMLAARTYVAAGDMAKVEQTLVRVLDVAPDNLQAYGMLGELYLSQKKMKEAREKFAEIARRQSKPVAAETMIGMILQMEGKDAEAKKQYEKVMAIDPRAAVAANNLAWMYVEAGENLDVAQQLAYTARAGRPDSPEVDDTLGWIYHKKGMRTQAAAELRAAVAKDPKKADYQYHLGMALLEAGNDAAARQALEKALQIDPNFSGAAAAKQALAGIRH